MSYCVQVMNISSIDETATYNILKSLEKNPELSQRQLSAALGFSLGKVNFCMKALIGKGCLKVNNFRTSNNKRAYAYLLTPLGMEEKSRLTLAFLHYKMQEYERLYNEIEELKTEARDLYDTGIATLIAGENA